MTETHTCWTGKPAVFTCDVHCIHGHDRDECFACAGVALVGSDQVHEDDEVHDDEDVALVERDLAEIARTGGNVADRRARRVQRETDRLRGVARSSRAHIARLRETTPGWPDNPIAVGPKPLTKDGQRRMAQARQAAGIPLSPRDRWALDLED